MGMPLGTPGCPHANLGSLAFLHLTDSALLTQGLKVPKGTQKAVARAAGSSSCGTDQHGQWSPGSRDTTEPGLGTGQPSTHHTVTLPQLQTQAGVKGGDEMPGGAVEFWEKV